MGRLVKGNIQVPDHSCQHGSKAQQQMSMCEVLKGILALGEGPL